MGPVALTQPIGSMVSGGQRAPAGSFSDARVPAEAGSPKTAEQLAFIISKIKDNILFSELSQSQLKTIAQSMAEVKVPPGKTLIKQGDPGDKVRACVRAVIHRGSPFPLIVTIVKITQCVAHAASSGKQQP